MSSSRDNIFFSFVEAACKIGKAVETDAMLILLDQSVNWTRLKKKTVAMDALVIATHSEEIQQSADEAGVNSVLLDMPEAPATTTTVHDRLAQAVLTSVAAELIPSGSTVVSIYEGFETGSIDSVSIIRLTERLGRLTPRELRKLETKVPLETLRTVVNLAVEIGREGREGKPVGTMFVVGDHRKVLQESRPSGFDLVKGYSRKERSLLDGKNRESIKELAQLDGMFVVSADGTVEGAARLVDTSPVEVTMTKGLGSRHYAGAAISKNTKGIAVVVSQSSGTVRIFQNGEVVLRIEPFQRAMIWKGFSEDSGASQGES